MAAPLLALPFLSNPLVLGALAVIGVGAYLYSNKQDSLIVQADGLYSEILGFFISFSSKILKGIGEPLANVIQPYHVTEIFDTPANLLNAGISNVVKGYQTNSAREHKIDTHHSITNANISFHVRQILTSLDKLYEYFKINNGLSLKTLIAAVLLLVILGLELFLLFKVFCYIFMT
ncbi:hypothetical protein HMPREF1429_00352 [Helicobacter pylori GAM93Bi]|nr:hypothetical protein [Helicobacter pylori]EMH44226.1 hypothetical protein HMPREF1429_00352 [Helicobacter pylori GAM93Bi]